MSTFIMTVDIQTVLENMAYLTTSVPKRSSVGVRWRVSYYDNYSRPLYLHVYSLTLHNLLSFFARGRIESNLKSNQTSAILFIFFWLALPAGTSWICAIARVINGFCEYADHKTNKLLTFSHPGSLNIPGTRWKKCVVKIGDQINMISKKLWSRISDHIRSQKFVIKNLWSYSITQICDHNI